jgi:UDP-2,3-diacylglucosamine hydrolase
VLARPPGATYLGRVICQRLVLVGDAHLGRGSPEAEHAFLDFLDAVPALGDGLLITGDLFEFWFSYRRAIPREGVRVIAALAQLRRHLPILMVGGNHDRWGGSFWERDLQVEYSAHEARFQAGGHPAYVVHGDGITETHWSARVLHRILRHDVTVGLYGLLHPDLGIWLVDGLSTWLGDRERTEAEVIASATRQAEWARARLAAEPGLGLLVMGHTHRAAAIEVAPGQLYVNPGAWFDGYRYALVQDGQASLLQFTR